MARLGLTDRRLAKTINFGVVYGIGPNSYHDNLFTNYGIDRPVKQCREDIDGFYATYRGVKPFKERVWEEGRRVGHVRTRFGRRRRLPFTSDDRSERSYAERQGVNCLIQGDVGDWMRGAMPVIDLGGIKEFGAGLLLQVHDELVLECPASESAGCAEYVKKTMEGVIPNFSVPIVADVGIGENWGETVKWESSTP